MIVGTAGHIDHGKTTLVGALTGVDTDRLPEERRRGISIELGYAYLDVPVTAAGRDAPARIGFVDVPGHERLVHTMLAGATGIDFALLLVAADDGVMPQTREHLAVLSLLGLARGAVAVTKVDRVDAARVAEVTAEVTALLADTPLRGAPVRPVSAHSGFGLDALRRLLFDAAAATGRAAGASPADGGAAFRLAIDRAFTLDGVGTVVTGAVHAGRVRIGDELALAPAANGLRARVRSLHAHDRAVTQAHAGQRCAVALAGIAKDQVRRGDWLVAPAVGLSTQRLDATLTLWHAEGRPLRSGTPVHVHVGADSALGTVTVLATAGAAAGAGMPRSAESGAADDVLLPGACGHVQIVLQRPIAAWHGDRLVLRDNSASRTLAGGRVLDPFAPTRYRRTAQRLAELAAWALPDAPQRLAALIDHSPHGIALGRWAVAEGQHAPGAAQGQEATRVVEGEEATGVAVATAANGAAAADGGLASAWPAGALRAADAANGDWALGGARQQSLREAALTALRSFHAGQPDNVGPAAGQLRRLAAPRLPEPLWRALLAAWQTAGDVAVRGGFVQLPEHGARLSIADSRLSQKLAPLLAQAGDEGAWARDLARATGESEALVRVTLARLAQRGELHQVVKDLYYGLPQVARLARLARQVAEAGGGDVTAAGFRDATGLGRKRAIQLLEYFDRIGLLRRVDDVHRWRGDMALFAGLAPDLPGSSDAGA